MQGIKQQTVLLDGEPIQLGVYQEITRGFLLRAGLRTGMRVLDAGCGGGRVAFIAATLVGGTGEVLGLDLSAQVLASANCRASELGLGNVRFAQGDLRDPPVHELFDAVIGRFVLTLVSEPARALARLASLVKPGGIIAFQELDFSGLRFSEPLPLCTQCRAWVLTALRATGADPEMGLKLHKTFIAAGLPAPSLSEEAIIGGGENFPGYELCAVSVKNLLSDIERLGIATRAQVDIDTLAARLKNEAIARNAVIALPSVIGAWARIAPPLPQKASAGEETRMERQV